MNDDDAGTVGADAFVCSGFFYMVEVILMTEIKSFAVIGGDKRQIYCGQSLQEDGFDVYFGGFDKCSEKHRLTAHKTDELIGLCDAFILPLPCTRDKLHVNAPFAEENIPLSLFESVKDKKPVFCGMKERLPFEGQKIYDYSTSEEFAVLNAVPTAEGAIETAMYEYEGTLNGSRCLVTGYGRIGKILSFMLRGIGADVTVSSQRKDAHAFIRAEGMKAILSSELCGRYDIIFNTAPSLLFDRKTLTSLVGSPLIIDLASYPGGVDTKAADDLSLRVMQALSLPGKVAPKSAGIIIKNAVYNILGEEL